jgi:rod shape-determining protein MreC
MENFFIRYKNPLVLMAVLFIQVVALATQVKREGPHGPANSGGTRLIRVWTITAITPFERGFVGTGHFFRRNWTNYIDLHNARKENRELQEEIARLKLEQIRYRQDAEQAQRLQTLLGFKQNYIGQIKAAQVIGTSGMEQSRTISIDKGSRDGVKVDMAVITPDGIVGKIKDVGPLSSQVLLVSDRESGAGVILQGSRLQGILRGTPQGELRVSDVMSDENIQVGEQVITSGGDRIYPKGVPVGTVTSVAPDHDNDPFLAIKIKPAADLARLEEVLIVTKSADDLPSSLAASTNQVRAADLLAQRLPSVTKPDATSKDKQAKAGSATPTSATSTATSATSPNLASAKPSSEKTVSGKPPFTKPAASPTPGTAVPLSGKPSATPSAGAAAATASPSPKPAAKKPATTTPASTNQATQNSTSATAPKLPASPTNAAGSPAASPSPTPKPKPQVKRPKSQATPAPASTDQPESKPPDGGAPDSQNPAPAAEKPPR